MEFQLFHAQGKTFSPTERRKPLGEFTFGAKKKFPYNIKAKLIKKKLYLLLNKIM